MREVLIGLALLVPAGCYSGVDMEPPGADDPSAASGANAEGDGGGSDDGADDDDAPEVAECEPGRVGLRRLNRREFGNSLRDLLGVDASIADNAPLDPFKGGFDTNASVLGITPELLDIYMGVVEDAVELGLTDLLACTPAAETFDDACVRETVLGFAERAYRRPLSAEEETDLADFFAASSSGTYEDAVSTVVQGVLTSPQFLYRNYVPESDEPQALDEYTLASRLSYFVWSSTPDQALLDAAASGELTDPDETLAQVKRMLADDKAEAFVQAFTTQWLDIAGLPSKAFNPELFPDVDGTVLALMQQETVAMVRHVFASDASPTELVTAGYSFINAELASRYEVGGVASAQLERTPLDASQRRGILTHLSVLAATSHPDRTSIPHRGMWVMENLLCLDPPPPPPDSVDTSEFGDDTEPTTQRERLEVHRERPECAACHVTMDNLGFGLENYGPTGQWRETDSGLPVDASGVLPGGDTFEGGPDLADLVARDDTFAQCLAGNLLSYAIGRLRMPDDDCALEKIVANPAEQTAAQLLTEIVMSDPFRFEGGS